MMAALHFTMAWIPPMLGALTAVGPPPPPADSDVFVIGGEGDDVIIGGEGSDIDVGAE